VETIFGLGSLLVLPFWALMIALPRRRWIERIARSPWIAAPPALLYAALVFPRLGVTGSFGSAVAVAALLGRVEGATVAWLHFLAFDLLVRRWVFLDARERGISSLFLAPVLLLTFLLGPLGFLLYLVARAVSGARDARPTGSSGAAP